MIIFLWGAFHMGAVGAALGTTLSQLLSVIVSLVFITKRKSEIPFAVKYLKPHKKTVLALLRVGVPVCLQDGFIQISFIIITIIANRRGLTDAAAVGIVEKIIGFMFLVPSSMLSAVSALGGAKFRSQKARACKADP